jgi:hypothetical protein
LAHLESLKDSAGFAEVPLDVTFICEYRHDIRVNHQSILDIDVEVLSNRLGRTKTIGSGSLDLANAVQMPIQTLLALRKDNSNVGYVKVELHSLCIARFSPAPEPVQFSVDPEAVRFAESDSELSHPITRQIETRIIEALTTNHLVVLDSKNSAGTILQHASYDLDYVVGITEKVMIELIFEIASCHLPQVDAQNPFRFVIAGNISFFATILKEYLAKSSEVLDFTFIFLPLKDNLASFAGEFQKDNRLFDNVDDQWFSIFQEGSMEQNVASIVNEKLAWITEAPLVEFRLPIAEILVTTASRQFIVPMFFMVTIGRYCRSGSRTHMKGTVFGEREKTMSVKFHHLALAVVGRRISMVWRVMNNVNPLPVNADLDRFTNQKKSRVGTKVILSLKKGQTIVRARIDEIEYKDVVGMTVTIRDPNCWVKMMCLKVDERRS